MSMLKKYVLDSSNRLSYKGIDIRPDLSYDHGVRILDHLFKKTLLHKEVPLVKLLWSKHGVEGVTLKHLVSLDSSL